MMTRHISILGILFSVAASFWLAGSVPATSSVQKRTFEFTYTAEVHDIPAGSKDIQIWLPYPPSDEYQKILKAKVSSAYSSQVLTASEYGNQMVHLDVKNPKTANIVLTMEFTVERDEHVHNGFAEVSSAGATSAPADLKRWLQPDHLVPLDQRIRELSAEVTVGKTTELAKARAIYDYVLANMKYDKSGTGWGNGDIYWACDAKRGNCTDFHSLFIGLARSAGIPAKFEIGFPLPASATSGEIAGYHCWAEFYLNGYGWVPIDASEAWKDPSKKEYFFGAHDANRVQFSIGRDLLLAPHQAGPALNYFVYPYVEVDGKTFFSVNKKFSFRDVNTAPISADATR
jgi:transglutaminase-like putative cysteine protease